MGVQLRCFRLLMAQDGLYGHQRRTLVQKDGRQRMPHFVRTDALFEAATLGDSLKDILYFMDGHAMWLALRDEECRIAVFPLTQIAFDPDACLRTKVHLAFLVAFAQNSHGAALPVNLVFFDALYLRNAATSGKRTRQARVLTRIHRSRGAVPIPR